jgi:hypothetical protein
MRCKFKLSSITRTEGTITKIGADGFPLADERGQRVTEPGEVWSLEFFPVYGNSDPKHENSVFWAYTPGGSLKLQTVNRAAVDRLELGREYYLDITEAVPVPA